jgi:hypothetical protein
MWNDVVILQVTEVRKKFLPMDGTLDIWVLGFFTILNLTAAIYGVIRLAQKNALVEWDNANESLKWIGVVFAIADASPGLLFFGCASPCFCVSFAPSP